MGGLTFRAVLGKSRVGPGGFARTRARAERGCLADSAPWGPAPRPFPQPARPAPSAGRVCAGRLQKPVSRVEGERQQKIKKEQMTSFSGRLRPTWTNFLGTVVEQPHCRWKHFKPDKARTFSALPKPGKGSLAVREPWVRREEGQIPPPSPRLGSRRQWATAPRSRSQFLPRSNTCRDTTSGGW